MWKSDITLPDSNIWPKILETADKYNYEMTLAALIMVQSAIKKIDKAKWISALRSKDVTKIENLIDNITFNGKKMNIVSKKLTNNIFVINFKSIYIYN